MNGREEPAPGWTLTTEPPVRRAGMTPAKRTVLLKVALRIFMALDDVSLLYLKAALGAELNARQPEEVDRNAAVRAYWRELYKKPQENHVEPRKSA